MTIGLIELINKGQEDKYLIGNPEITFFKSVYKKYHNFAFEDILCNFESKPQLGSKNYSKIEYIGDLLKDMYIRLNFNGTILTTNLNININDFNKVNILKDSPIYIGTDISLNFAQNSSVINNWNPINNGEESILNERNNAFDHQDFITFTPKRNIRYIKINDNTYRYYYNRNLSGNTKFKFILNNSNLEFHLYKGDIMNSTNLTEIVQDVNGYYNLDDGEISSFKEVNYSYKVKYLKKTLSGELLLESIGLISSSNNISSTREFFNYNVNNNFYKINNDDSIYINLDDEILNYNIDGELEQKEDYIYLYKNKYNINKNELFSLKCYNEINEEISIINNQLDLTFYEADKIKFHLNYLKEHIQNVNNNKRKFIVNEINIISYLKTKSVNFNLDNLIKNVSINFNEYKIDEYDFNFNNIYNNFFIKTENEYKLYNNLTQLNNVSILNNNYFYIPLRFWFNNKLETALPLLALKKTNIILNIEFNNIELNIEHNIFKNIQINNCNLLCTYIFLDDFQKKYFTNNKISYLIEQHQHINQKLNISQNPVENIINLIFHYQIKYITWVLPKDCILHSAKINFNNEESEELDGEYYHSVIPFKLKLKNKYNISRISENNTNSYYIYNFCLNLDDYQPSGSCNFSRINTKLLILKVYNKKLTNQISYITCPIYAVNYNNLEIQNGTFSLLF